MNTICLCVTFPLTIVPQGGCSGTGQRSDTQVTPVGGNI